MPTAVGSRPGPEKYAWCGILPALVVVALGAGSIELGAQSRGSGPSGAVPGPRAFRDSCTTRDLVGQFGFFGSGTVLASPVNGLAGPFARVGILIADGVGNLAFESQAAFNGIHFHQEVTGRYTMRPDCTFISNLALKFDHPSIQPFTLQVTFLGILSDEGREMVDIFMEPPGVVIYGKARKQGISRCGVRDLFGSYQLDLNGSTLDLGFPLPFTGGGRIEADGNGNIKGQGAFNSGGFPIPADISGSYTVATNCTFEISYCVLAPDGRTCQRHYALHGAFLDEARAAYLIMTEPQSAVVLGNLKAQ